MEKDYTSAIGNLISMVELMIEFASGEMVVCTDTRSLKQSIGIVLKKTSAKDSFGNKYFEILTALGIEIYPTANLRKLS